MKANGKVAPVFYDRYLILPLVMVYAITVQRARRLLAYAFIGTFALMAVAHVTYLSRHPATPDVPVPLTWQAIDAG